MDIYEVGPFRLDPEASLLTLSGVPVALGRRAIGVLTALVQSPQECVAKARLLDAAWPGLSSKRVTSRSRSCRCDVRLRRRRTAKAG